MFLRDFATDQVCFDYVKRWKKPTEGFQREDRPSASSLTAPEQQAHNARNEGLQNESLSYSTVVYLIRRPSWHRTETISKQPLRAARIEKETQISRIRPWVDYFERFSRIDFRLYNLIIKESLRKIDKSLLTDANHDSKFHKSCVSRQPEPTTLNYGVTRQQSPTVTFFYVTSRAQRQPSPKEIQRGANANGARRIRNIEVLAPQCENMVRKPKKPATSKTITSRNGDLKEARAIEKTKQGFRHESKNSLSGKLKWFRSFLCCKRFTKTRSKKDARLQQEAAMRATHYSGPSRIMNTKPSGTKMINMEDASNDGSDTENDDNDSSSSDDMSAGSKGLISSLGDSSGGSDSESYNSEQDSSCSNDRDALEIEEEEQQNIFKLPDERSSAEDNDVDDTTDASSDSVDEYSFTEESDLEIDENARSNVTWNKT